MSAVVVRKAEQRDVERVLSLLEHASLPTAGVAEHFDNFIVAEDGSGVVGAIGLEVYNDVALLRSAVVEATQQNNGIGSRLYDHALKYAKAIGVRRLILLTNTAEQYFTKKGFKRIGPNSVRGAIRHSAEFSGACPSSAVCMQLILTEG